MDFHIKTIKHQIAATQRLVDSGLKQYVVQLIDLESRLEELENLEEQRKDTKIEVFSYRYKGVNAYIVPLGGSKHDYYYGKPSTQWDEQLAHRSKRHSVTFDLNKLTDGLYRLQGYDKCTGKSYYRYFKIENHKVVDDADTEKELLPPVVPNLPELEGSPKQIKWANDIREQMIKKFLDNDKELHSQFFTETSAKKYIDYHVKNNR